MSGLPQAQEPGVRPKLTPAQQRDADMCQRFDRETSEHTMTVLRDDGLYRHLRFQQPGTSMYYFDLVTWPGVLAISGDCGAYMFSRIDDMFRFFESQRDGINPHYWSEKLRAPEQRGVKAYSVEAFKERVLEWLTDSTGDIEEDEAAELREAVYEQILDDPDGYLHDEGVARLRLHEFEHAGRHIVDDWEWSFWEYDNQFLWCCWAIVRGIAEYRAAKLTPAGAGS